MIDLAPLTERLDWALSHLEALNREVRRFLDTEPYTVTTERNPDTGGYLWRVAVRSGAPRRLSFLVGDCVHSIRSTLDNLVWLLSEGSSEKVRRNAAFVISADAEGFRNGRWKLDGLPDRVQRLIVDAQPFAPDQLPGTGRYIVAHSGLGPGLDTTSDLEDPYARTDERGRAEKHPLWLLERLWNDDKHRAPALIGAMSRSSNFSSTNLHIPAHSAFQFDMFVGVIHDGDKIAQFIPPDGFRSEAEIKLKPLFEIALDKEGEGFKEPVGDLLRKLHDHVRNTLLPQFAKL